MTLLGRLVTSVTAGAALVCGAGLTYLYYSDPGTQRSVHLWKNLGPVIAHYRYVETKHKYFPPASAEEEDREWNRLHERYSDHVLGTFQSLRGFYVKMGQVIASRKDMLPDIYTEKLRTLEDNVAHNVDSETVSSLMKSSLGVNDLREIFEKFDARQPIGTASIGQVFRATLKESSTEVAVKVQVPGVEELFRSDIKTARLFCTLMAPEQVIVFDEIERQFMTEFDYSKEALQLDQVRRNMKQFKNVKVPKPFLKYCTKEVLVMEYLPGPKLIDGIRGMGRKWAAAQGINFEEMQREAIAKYEREGLPPPYRGPSERVLDVYRKLLSTWDLLRNFPLMLYNIGAQVIKKISVGLVLLPLASYHHSFIPLNSARIMSTLLTVHGHQILVNGFFNADPHAGNFLLLPDERIGLIDYGQVKRFNRDQRILLAKLIVALFHNDQKRVVELIQENGYKSKYSNPQVMLKMAVVVLDQDGRDVTGGLNLQQFMDKMYETDPWEKTGDVVIMPTRVSFLLRSIGLMMNHPVSVVRVWGPIAERVLVQEGELYSA